MFGESFWIPQSLERLYIEVGTEEDCGPAGYIILKDEGGHIRLQKLIGYGSPLICIGRGPCDTSIGGVPGSVGAGRWELIIYIYRIREAASGRRRMYSDSQTGRHGRGRRSAAGLYRQALLGERQGRWGTAPRYV